jgi:hypothetical protein
MQHANVAAKIAERRSIVDLPERLRVMRLGAVQDAPAHPANGIDLFLGAPKSLYSCRSPVRREPADSPVRRAAMPGVKVSASQSGIFQKTKPVTPV